MISYYKHHQNKGEEMLAIQIDNPIIEDYFGDSRTIQKVLEFIAINKISIDDKSIEESPLNKYKQTEQFQEDKNKLHQTYQNIIDGKASLLSQGEFDDKMESFIAELKVKYANN